MNMSEAEAEQEPYLRVVLIMDRKHNCPGASQNVPCARRSEMSFLQLSLSSFGRVWTGVSIRSQLFFSR